MKLEKFTPWIPLLIAAGYFLFLVATWQKFIASMKASDDKLDAWLKRLEPKTEEG